MDHFPSWHPIPEDKPDLGDTPCIHATALVQNSQLGAWTEIGPFASVIDSTLDDYSYVAGSHSHLIYTEIGKFSSIAGGVCLNPVAHPMDRVTQHHCTYRRRQYGFGDGDDDAIFQWRRRQTVTVGADVWIGRGAIVMPGVQVHSGAVVGSGAVVTRDVAPYTIVAGAPAQPIRKRFPSRIIVALLAIRWWEWPRETLVERFDDLLDIYEFTRKHHRSEANLCQVNTANPIR